MMLVGSFAMAATLGSVTIPAGGAKAGISTGGLNPNFLYNATCHIQNPVVNNIIKISGASLNGGGIWTSKLNGEPLSSISLDAQTQLKQGDNILEISGLQPQFLSEIDFFNADMTKVMNIYSDMESLQ